MKLAVFGASGRTGQILCRQAMEKGHEVVAIVRDPAKVNFSSGVQVRKADVFSQPDLESVLVGVDVVFDCLGSNDLKKTRVQRDSIVVILDAMRACGVKRIIVLGASGALHDPMKHETLGRKLFFWIIRSTFLKHPMDDSGAQQKIVEASEMEYTIVHPPRLTSAPRAGKYRVDPEGLPKGGRELGREDLAEFMLSQIDDDASIRQGPYVAY